MRISALLLASVFILPLSVLAQDSLSYDKLGRAKFEEEDFKGAAEYWQKALTAAREEKDTKAAARHSRNLAEALMRSGNVKEAAPLLKDAIEAYPAESLEHADVLILVGWQRLGMKEHDRALAELGKALKSAEALRNIPLEQRCHEALGAVRRSQKEYQKAMKHLRRARQLARLREDTKVELASIADIGWLQDEMGLLEDAGKTFTERLELARKKGSPRQELSAYADLGNLYFSTGAYSRAREHFAGQVRASVKLGGKREEASARKNLSATLYRLKDLDGAVEEIQRALQTARASKDVVTQADVLRAQGGIAEGAQDWPLTFKAYEEAAGLSREADHRWEERQAVEALARIAQDRQDWARAEGYQLRLLEKARSDKNVERERAALYRLGELRSSLQDYAGTIKYHEQVLAMTREAGERNLEAAALLMLSLARISAGDKEGAMRDIEASIKIFRALKLKEEEHHALSTFGAALIEFKDYRKGLDSLNQALDLLGPDGSPKSRAGILELSANAWMGMKRPQMALKVLAGARKLFHEADAKREGFVVLNMAHILDGIGQKNEAFKLYEEAAELGRKTKQPGIEKIALTKMGDLNDNIGRWNEAGDFYLQALKAVEPYGMRNLEASALVHLGTFFQRIGKLGRSLGYFERALALQKTTGDRPAQLITNGNAGNLFSSLGDYDKAREHFQRALALAEDLNDQVAMAILLNNIGETYSRQDELTAALEHFNKSMNLSREVDRSTWSARSHIAGVYLAQGKLEAARDIYEQIDDPLGLAMYYLRTGKDEDARKQFDRAANSARRINDAERFTAAYTGGAMALERLGKTELARRAYDIAIEGLEAQRSALPPAARSHFFLARSEFLPRLEAYEGRARTAWDDRDGFYWSENTKSRLFIEALSSSEAGVDKLPANLAKAEAKLKKFQAWLLKQESEARQAKDNNRLQQVAKDLIAAKKEQIEFLTRLRRLAPQYAAAQYPEPMPPDQISLENDEALLEYEVTASTTLIYIITADHKVRSVKVDVGREELRALVKAFRKPFEEPLDAEGRFAGKYDLEAGTRLYKLLLLSALTATDSVNQLAVIPFGARLIIVPDEMLGLLPFEALPIDPARKTKETWRTAPGPQGLPVLLAPEGGGFAGDDYDITYAQSATALTLSRALRHDSTKAQGMFVLADPVFDRSDPRLKGEGLDAFLQGDEIARVRNGVKQTLMGVGGTRGGGPALPRLEETGALARRLERAFGKDVVSVTGRRASEDTVRNEDLARYRHLIFATHGLLASDLPYLQEPALVLSQAGNNRDADGFLTMSEVMKLKLKADVVALTACKTGIGRELSGEGVMGLGRGFQYAGARAVMVSLWSVAEQSTTLLTEDFFKTIRAGKPPREALRTARRHIREAGYDHPFFWAPFILVGQ